MIRKINCSILIPERTLFEGEIDLAIVQAHNGELGFLYDHAPLISELGIGEIRLREGQNIEYFVVEGGIAQIKDNNLIIIAENAFKKNDLNLDELNAQFKEFTEKDGQIEERYSEESILIKDELQKISARIKVASR